MPVVTRTRTLDAPRERVWNVVGDPDLLPRWWPDVARVERATEREWTTVIPSPKGKTLRADHTLIDRRDGELLSWRHEVEESPFERLLRSAEYEVTLSGEEETEVSLQARLRLKGLANLGTKQVRRATEKQLDRALDGLRDLSEGEGQG